MYRKQKSVDVEFGNVSELISKMSPTGFACQSFKALGVSIFIDQSPAKASSGRNSFSNALSVSKQWRSARAASATGISSSGSNVST
jgi:hypothetical protein